MLNVDNPGGTGPALHRSSSVRLGNSVDLIEAVPSNHVDLILSDIPYGIGAADWDVLHSNTNSALRGSSPAQERAGAIFRSRGKPLNGWSEADKRIPREYYDWCGEWARGWLRVLKPGGSAVVFAGRRLSHRCAAALEDAGFTYKDTLAWIRPRAAFRAQRLSVVYERRGDVGNADEWEGWRVGNLRPVFEPVLWLTKPYKVGTTIADNVLGHGVGAFNEVAFAGYTGASDNVLRIGFESAERTGLHPMQKPLKLMEALISLTTQPGQLVLDPFAGSGSTLVAAHRLGRRSIGFEVDPEYCATAERRLDAAESQPGRNVSRQERLL